MIGDGSSAWDRDFGDHGMDDTKGSQGEEKTKNIKTLRAAFLAFPNRCRSRQIIEDKKQKILCICRAPSLATSFYPFEKPSGSLGPSRDYTGTVSLLSC